MDFEGVVRGKESDYYVDVRVVENFRRDLI